MKCRHCAAQLKHTFLDLGNAPPSNAYLTEKTLRTPETWYPLRIMVCENCWLVQTEDHAGREDLFTHEYAYFSSYSSTWLKHAEKYVQHVIKQLELNSTSCVVEVAANDGYLLQYIKKEGIPCYGIEPTHSTAVAARNKGIEIIEGFFGQQLANELVMRGRKADLIIANNVLAHVPDINDFVSAFQSLLKPDGIATFEFPHLINMVYENQFDTAYHEHYSYLSFTAVHKIFQNNGLSIYDVEKLPTHGGSLRVYAQRKDEEVRDVKLSVKNILDDEFMLGIQKTEFYSKLQINAEKIKNEFLLFLLSAKKNGLKVGAYGAAAKGNTLLNYAGIKSDLLPYVIDKNIEKIGKYLPGSRIQIMDQDFLKKDRPNYIIILPWNLRNEIIKQLNYVNDWGAQFVVAIPSVEVIKINV